MVTCFSKYLILLFMSEHPLSWLTSPIVSFDRYHLVELREYNTFAPQSVHEVRYNHIMLEGEGGIR